MSTQFIQIDDVMAIHDRIIKDIGGGIGMLSFTLLHSAVERPKATFTGYELYPTIFEKAAALIHSLIQNHPFNDGNKRTAFVSTTRFLYINGYKLSGTVAEIVNFTLTIQKKKTNFENIASWLEKHSSKG